MSSSSEDMPAIIPRREVRLSNINFEPLKDYQYEHFMKVKEMTNDVSRDVSATGGIGYFPDNNTFSRPGI